MIIPAAGTWPPHGTYTNVLHPSCIRTRDVVDRVTGLRWSVVEVGGGARAGRGPCLLVVASATVRRVWHYPHDWLDLDDAALIALCSGT